MVLFCSKMTLSKHTKIAITNAWSGVVFWRHKLADTPLCLAN